MKSRPLPFIAINDPHQSSMKLAQSSSDKSFNPFAHPSDDEEEMEVEQEARPEPPQKKPKKKKKEPKSVSCEPSRVTRSKVQSGKSAPQQPSSSKGKSRKIQIPGNSSDPSRFYTELNKEVWNFVSQRSCISERPLHNSEFKELGVFDLLESQGLLGTVSKIKPFVKSVVHEFFANLVREINNPATDVFHKVYVRGHMFDFSPKVINEFLQSSRTVVDFEADFDVIIAELTANVRTQWPSAKSFPAAELSLKYSVLHKIALKNWMPSLHATGVKKSLAELLFLIGTATPFDIGQLIYDQVVQNAEVTTTHSILPFPSLIFGVLMKQKTITTPDDMYEKPSEALRISKKLHTGKHVVDIQGESSSGEEADVPSGVATKSSLNARTVHFLTTDLSDLTAYKAHLLQELSRVDRKMKDISALLEDLQSSSAATDRGTS